MDIEEIKETIKDNEIQKKDYIPLRAKSDTRYFYLLTVATETQINEVKRLNNRSNVSVT